MELHLWTFHVLANLTDEGEKRNREYLRALGPPVGSVYSPYFPCAALFLRSSQVVAFFWSSIPYLFAFTRSALRASAFLGLPEDVSTTGTPAVLHS